ncbi:MAG: hypothetical protein IT204_12570 [Fimbriimonadaceae bacterium]|nr:hypothetical protein [Fimbriimonadaceae bacterium]
MTTVQEINDRAVEQLVAAHRQRTTETLRLVIRFDPAGTGPDIHLLEVLDEFPGDDTDELLHAEFEPSANLLFLGRLHLYLGSPAQALGAVVRGDAVIAAARSGQVVYSDQSDLAEQLRTAVLGG